MGIDDEKVARINAGFLKRLVGRKEKERVAGILFNEVAQPQRSRFRAVGKGRIGRAGTHGEGLERQAAEFYSRPSSGINEAFAPIAQFSQFEFGTEPLRTAGSPEGLSLGGRHADLNRFREPFAPAGLSSCSHAVAASPGTSFWVRFIRRHD